MANGLALLSQWSVSLNLSHVSSFQFSYVVLYEPLRYVSAITSDVMLLRLLHCFEWTWLSAMNH